MPEFILDHGSIDGTRTFNSLDAFTQGYIEAAFFTNEEEIDGATVAEIAPSSLQDVIADCTAWQAKAADLLELAYDRKYTAEQAGRDYWFTRNGHGVGFWDRKELEEDHSDKPESLGGALSAICRYSDVDLYRGDDGLIYFS